MKTIRLFILLISFVFIGLDSVAQSSSRIKLKFILRTMSSNGNDCSERKGICVEFSFERSIDHPSSGLLECSIENDQLRMIILQDNSPAEEDENTFTISKELAIPEEYARQLGYEQIILQPGEYRLDKSRNPLGSVLIKAEFR